MKRPYTKILPYYTRPERRVIWYVVNQFTHQGRNFTIWVN